MPDMLDLVFVEISLTKVRQIKQLSYPASFDVLKLVTRKKLHMMERNLEWN